MLKLSTRDKLTVAVHVYRVGLCLRTAATNRPVVHAQTIYDCREPLGTDIDRGKPKKSEKASPSSNMFVTSFLWTGPGAKSALRGERPGINRLSHGTAQRQT
jgi:hypothetical protein